MRSYIQVHWRWLLWLVLPLISLLMHLHLLDRPLQGIHAWRQCETGSNVVNFANGGSLLHPQVFSLEWENGYKRMEFPIMQWVMGQVVKVFGNETLMMRLISWLLGMGAMMGIFYLFDLIFKDKLVALAGAWCWLHSPLLFYYIINPLPDNLSLMAAIWGFVYFMRWYLGKRSASLVFCFGFLSLATATKLPFIVFFAVPFGALLGELLRGRTIAILGNVVAKSILGLSLLAPAAIWYISVIPEWTGNGVVKGILDLGVHELPTVLDYFGQNLVSTLPELLVNYAALLFFFWGIWRIIADRLYQHRLALPFGLMAVGVIAYYVFEINMITTIHDYYLFPFMPGIALLIGLGLQGMLRVGNRWLSIAALTMLLALPVTAALRTYSRWHEQGTINELLVNVDALRAATPSNARIIVGHDLSPHITLFHLRHFGWTISKDKIDPKKIEKYLVEGASFLYSSSLEIESNPAISSHLGTLVGEWGSWRVWSLR